jgi:hypothetical protein
MNATELLTHLAERTGYPMDALKDVIANPALAQITLPEDFKPTLNSLMTIKEAKINGEIKKHFTGTALGSMDAALAELMDEYQLADDVKATLKEEQNTYTRAKLFTKALAEQKDQQLTATGGDKAKLVQQIQELNGTIVALKDSTKAELSKKDSEWLSKFMDTTINSHFDKYDYAMDNVPANIQAMTARQMYEQKLAEKGGKMKYVDGKVVLVSATDDALPFTIDNKEVAFDKFTDSIVYDNKLARVKGQPHANPTPNHTPTPNTPPNMIVAPAAKAQTSQALADLRAGS